MRAPFVLVVAAGACAVRLPPPPPNPPWPDGPREQAQPYGTSPSGTAARPPATAAPPSTAAPAPTPAPPEERARLVVSFISHGNGTNLEAAEALDLIVEAYAERGVDLGHTSHRWGKEGEHDECFTLAALDAAGQTAVVAEVQKAMAHDDRVQVQENAVCHPAR
jgi:hypothetical protein